MTSCAQGHTLCGNRVSLGFNLFDYKAGVWSSVSDGRGLELEVTESQSEGRMEMNGKGAGGRQEPLRLCAGPRSGVPGGEPQCCLLTCKQASRLTPRWGTVSLGMPAFLAGHCGSRWRSEVSGESEPPGPRPFIWGAGASATSRRKSSAGENQQPSWPFTSPGLRLKEGQKVTPKVRLSMLRLPFWRADQRAIISRGGQKGCAETHFYLCATGI